MKNKFKKTIETLILSTALASGCGNTINTPIIIEQQPQLQYHRDINGDEITDLIRVCDDGMVVVEIGTEDHAIFFPKTPYRLTFSDQNRDGYTDILAHITQERENKTYISYQMQNDRGNVYFTRAHLLRTDSSR